MNKLICAVAVLAVSTAHADTIFVDDDAVGGGMVNLSGHPTLVDGQFVANRALAEDSASGARAGLLINFDTDAFGNSIAAPCTFFRTTALRDLYTPLGVTFAGPGPNDGGAILDECGNFGVPALSGANFLAFNRNAEMQDGGIPTDPQIIIFDPVASVVSIWVAGGNQNGSFLMEAFDVDDMLLDSDSVITQGYSQLSVSAEGIKRVVLTEMGLHTDEFWVFDDLQFEAVADQDGDGIPDDEDACPDSDLAETIVIDGCDSGVENMLFGDGCTMADLIAECADGASNHGDFVSCVAHLTNEWKRAGLITGQEKGAIQSCAAQSNIPGDLDGDGAVGIDDFLLLLGAWGSCPAQPDSCPADVDLDSNVGITDFLILLGNWG